MQFVTDICEVNVDEEKIHGLWLAHFMKICEHPSGSDLIYYPKEGAGDGPEHIVKAIKEWRSANGKCGFRASRPQIDIHALPEHISDFTEAEFHGFVVNVLEDDFDTDCCSVEAILAFERLAEHPDGYEMLYTPMETRSEWVVRTVKEWRAANGKAGFKPEPVAVAK